MDPNQLKSAWDWGGWPAVATVIALWLLKWYCDKKLTQDREHYKTRLDQETQYHQERMAEAKATQQMLGYLADAVSAMVYKNLGDEEGVRVMMEIARRRVESATTAERVASQKPHQP